jgi:hypothetical protein
MHGPEQNELAYCFAWDQIYAIATKTGPDMRENSPETNPTRLKRHPTNNLGSEERDHEE